MMPTVHGIDVDVSGSGPFTIVDGSSHNGLKVFRVILTVDTGNPTITFYSNDVKLPGTFHMRSGGAIALGMEKRRWAECSPGSSLIMHVSEPATIGGAVTVQYL